MLHTGLRRLHDNRMEKLIELINSGCPFHLALGDQVELLLDVSRKIIIEYVREIGHQEIIHHKADIGRDQLIPVGAVNLAFLDRADLPIFRERHDLISPLNALLIPFRHILTILYGLDRWGISGRPPDTQFLHTTYQASLRITGRTLRETLGSDHIAQA